MHQRLVSLLIWPLCKAFSTKTAHVGLDFVVYTLDMCPQVAHGAELLLAGWADPLSARRDCGTRLGHKGRGFSLCLRWVELTLNNVT